MLNFANTIFRQMFIAYMLMATIVLFILSVFIQALYFQGVFRRLAKFTAKKPVSPSSFPPVSVIISARNEEKYLMDYLPLVLEQEYPEYEVVVVDDGSTDKTYHILEQYSHQYGHLRIVKEMGNQGKKAALSKGISAAHHELLLFTDADCKPASKSWLQRMASNFIPGKDIVVGFGPLLSAPGILNAIIRFDALQTAIQYLSFAFNGKTYMGVGRNLAYRKSLWMNHGGFESHKELLSGDDDLFINHSASSTNTTVEIHPSAWTLSPAPTTLNNLFQQKRRHLTTGVRYPFKTILMLWLFPLSTVLFYVSGLILLLTGTMVISVLVLAGFRFFLQYVLLNNCCNRLGDKDLLLFSPLLEISHIILNFSAGFTNQFYPKSQWH